MCGLIAAFSHTPFSRDALSSGLNHMQKRGPDAEGRWQEGGVCFGHRRLAILDLDSRAVQPMHSDCGRYVIVFNGEIYNYKALRSELETQSIAFRTTSDTEVILSLFATLGEAMLPKLHGMFAFVIWDRETRRAFAARDPYGIKPLYIAKIADGVILASQVKALLATGLVSREPDLQGQAGFWMLGSVPEPHTWFRDIQALPAGYIMWIEEGKVVSSRYWKNIGEAWQTAKTTPGNLEEIRDHVKSALRESVERHLVADVPVGVFLSGGIDSGALAGLMVDAGMRDLEGITITYDEYDGCHEDEAPVAAEIARHYGIRHHVRRVTREEFLFDLPRILDAMDQPTIDGINTWYASKVVAECGLKVVVSGVGGDELFLGYESFRQLPRLVSRWNMFSHVPGVVPLARLAGIFYARRSGNSRWKFAPDWLRSVASAWWLRRSVCSPDDLPDLIGRKASEDVLRDFDASSWVHAMVGALNSQPELALAQVESMMYLRNQLLRDSDWSSMDHSVELRTPLVDAHLLHQVQPYLMQFVNFPNKSLLATAPIKPLPQEIIKRRKTGFGIPVKRWLAESDLGGETTDRFSWMREVAKTYGGVT